MRKRIFARARPAFLCMFLALLLPCAGCSLERIGAGAADLLEALFSPAFEAPAALEEPDYVDFSVFRLLYGGLNEAQRQAYRAIYNAAPAQPEKIRIPALTEAELSEVLLAVKYDNPFLLCFSTEYSFSRIGNFYSLLPRYLSDPAESRARAVSLVEAAGRLLAGEAGGGTLFERELAAHDALCARCAYADGPLAATAYGAVVEGGAICEGYALAAKLLFDLQGIESTVVWGDAAAKGEAPESHMWNAARLDTGWYFLDCTWDDPVTEDGLDATRHFYFNLSEAELRVTHSGFSLPPGIECANTAENYYRQKDLFCTDDTWRTLTARVIAAAGAGETAELRFSSAALLEAACDELFDGGWINTLGAGTDWRRFSYSVDPDACALLFHFYPVQS